MERSDRSPLAIARLLMSSQAALHVSNMAELRFSVWAAMYCFMIESPG